MTPRGAGPGGAPAAFKSPVPGLQVRACALRGGGSGSFCPRVPTRRAQSGVGAVPAPRAPGPALGTEALAPGRPVPGSASPQPAPQLFPGPGPKGAGTSHEASLSWSLSTHTTRSHGKKNLVHSLFSLPHSEFRDPLGASLERGDPPPPHTHTHPMSNSPILHIPSGVSQLTLSSPPSWTLSTSKTTSSSRTRECFTSNLHPQRCRQERTWNENDMRTCR